MEVVTSNYITYNINWRNKGMPILQKKCQELNIENEEMSPWKYSLWHLVVTDMKTSQWPCQCFLYYESKIWEVERWVINHSKHITHSEIWIHIAARKIANHKKTWGSENSFCNSQYFEICWYILYDPCMVSFIKKEWSLGIGKTNVIYGTCWMKCLYMSFRPSW